MTDKVYLACVTTDMSAVPNSVEGRCGTCDVAVWISVSGQRVMKSKDEVIITCIPCLSTLPEDERKEFHAVPGGIKKAIDYLRKSGNASNN